MRILLTLIIASLTSCSTTLYQDGKPVARFQGDMRNSVFLRDSKGGMVWIANGVDHSTPTIAAGQAGSNRLAAAGFAIATSGLTTLIK